MPRPYSGLAWRLLRSGKVTRFRAIDARERLELKRGIYKTIRAHR
jgi:hypothetical protein